MQINNLEVSPWRQDYRLPCDFSESKEHHPTSNIFNPLILELAAGITKIDLRWHYEPLYNEPLYNENSTITNGIFHPSYSKK